jgi:glycosyltransferase involved in cell wall biosynthesis
MKPLVSILMPAYNAENWISYSLQSAVDQTWPNKEIIVVDDGSKDRTAEVARRFASKNVKVVSQPNGGLSAAVNTAYRESQGDYIQELDSDDLMLPDKIERQLTALQRAGNDRLLASSPWAFFYFRTRHARFINTSLCQSLSPVEWLLRKMGENLHMQNATWLVKRELAEAAGPWDEALNYDQDGEYFVRLLGKSEGTVFVPETGIFYRLSGTNSISYIGTSDKKRESLLRSMKLHIQYLRSLEDSARVRQACLNYLRTWYPNFYPARPDLVVQLQTIASDLGGQLEPPRLRSKYAWMEGIFGRDLAERAQRFFPVVKSSAYRSFDKFMFDLESHRYGGTQSASAASLTQ